MYEELVTDIRYCVSGDKPCGECKHIEELCCDNTLLEKAADAIEQLQKDLERSKEYEAFWEKEATEALRRFQVAIASKPRWIPVTERLPDAGLGNFSKDVFVTDGQGVAISAWYNGDAVASYWSYTGIGEVTHWMSLPAPPKEETE